jgi:hypothetical protein
MKMHIVLKRSELSPGWFDCSIQPWRGADYWHTWKSQLLANTFGDAVRLLHKIALSEREYLRGLN